MEPLFLSEEDIRVLHTDQIRQFGGRAGLRDETLLQSAVGPAQHVFLYRADATLFDLAATYAYHLSMNQSFMDGDKRTGLAAAISFLRINGYDVETAQENLFAWMIDLHSGPAARDALATHLRNCSVRNGGLTDWLRRLFGG